MVLDENEPESGLSRPLFVPHAIQLDEFRQTGAIT
jgi:hypothetical protein